MKNQIAVFKNQIVISFIVGGAIIIATGIFIFALIRLVCVLGITAALGRPISKKFAHSLNPALAAVSECMRRLARLPVFDSQRY
jgi:hypothetical protein